MKTTCTVWILGNQLHRRHPALEQIQADFPRDRIQVLMIESDRMIHHHPAPFLRRVLVLSAMRHYAQELRQAGFQVDYRRAPAISLAFRDHIRRHQPSRVVTMASSNLRGRRTQRAALSSLKEAAGELLPNRQFLVEEFNPYPDTSPDKNIRQETFYRRMRDHFEVLMEAHGQPLGGQWNFDADNRQRLPANLDPPQIRRFPPDAITSEVIQELKAQVEDSPTFDLAVDRQGANQALEDFLATRLEHFGAYQDAMTSRSSVLYHSLLSPYLNLGLLEPLEVIREVEGAYHDGLAPLNSVEGFIRQVLGWREYMYWQYWRQGEDLLTANHFDAQRDLPEFFWTGRIQLRCLQQVIQNALRTGYSHHIERLMILSNFCSLAGVQPLQVLEWFMASYLDAYDWVMAPNLIGMGLHADGGRIGTKPYLSSANYINKMSDFCPDCVYNHRQRTGDQACPFNYLYWNFLIQQESILAGNPRMNLSLANLRKIQPQERARILDQAREFLGKI